MISQGAEAKVFLQDGHVVKNRFPKTYRIKDIDFPLRRQRTRREASILEKIPEGINAPKLLKMDDKSMDIHMEHIKGEKLRDILDSRPELAMEIGRDVAKLHNAGIIHGDLTTSNMIWSDGRLFLIDFGLSYFSQKIEDMAVDLHLLRQALESKHYKIYGSAFPLVLEGYKQQSKDHQSIYNRFLLVEKRGRNKDKY